MAQSTQGQQGGLNTLLIVVVAQMGCLTVIVIVLSVALGLWLDNTLHTKPGFTLILLLAGVPVSVLLMLLVGRRTLARFQARNKAAQSRRSQPNDGGGTLGGD